LPLLLDPIERGVHDGAIGLELRISDVVTKAVVQRKDPPQRPQGLVGLVSHARRQHAQCDIRIVPEQRGDDRCPQGRTELLVEIVFQSERSLPRGGVTGIERRRRIALFERGDDLGRIADRPAVQEQDGQRTGVLKFFTNLDDSLMERLQREFSGACFVKAFNSVGNACMVNPQFKGGRPTMFICGNDEQAKGIVSGILDQFGWETADMGKAEAARAIEPLCMLWCIPGFLRNDWVHAFKLLTQA